MTRKARLLAVAVVALIAAPVLAHGPHGRGGLMGPGLHAHRGLLAELDLTVEQRDGIRDLFSAHRLAMQPQREERRAAHRALFDAIHAQTYNEAAVRAAASQLSAAEADAAVARANLFRDIQALLTPEQRAEMRERLAERRDGFGPGFEPFVDGDGDGDGDGEEF